MKCKNCGKPSVINPCFACMKQKLEQHMDHAIIFGVDLGTEPKGILQVCPVCKGPMEATTINTIAGMCRRCFKTMTFGQMYASKDLMDWDTIATKAISWDDSSNPEPLTYEKLKELHEQLKSPEPPQYKPSEKFTQWLKGDFTHALSKSDLLWKDTFKYVDDSLKSPLFQLPPHDVYNCRCEITLEPPPFWDAPITDKEHWLWDLKINMTCHFGSTDPRLEAR